MPFVSRRVGEDGQQAECRDRLLFALQVERGDRLHLDRILHQPIGRLAEEDLAWRSGLLQSGGDVHRVARHETLAGGRVAGNDFTGVHPDPSRDPDAVLAFELEVERLQRLPHAGGGPDRAQRVVLVQPGDPEDGHHRIADELLDGPAVSFDHGRHLVEVPTHDAAERFGIQPLAERRWIR